MLLGPQNWSLNFFFCKFWFFLIFLDFSYQHRLEWGKSVVFKNNALKVERVPMIFENLNSFETMLKILKWCKYIKKSIFLDFQCFSLFLDFSEKYQNMGQKLSSNRCPLFTMLTKQNFSMFCIVSFVKRNLSFCLFNLLNIHSSKDLALFFFSVLSSFSFLPLLSLFLSFSLSFFFVNLRSHLAISFSKNKECV